MMKYVRTNQWFSREVIWAVLALGALILTGCGGSDDHDHDHEDHEGHGHVHHAPHGGALTMLGDHIFQLELVPDVEAKRLNLYILDGEAENFRRIVAPTIEGVAKVGEREWVLLFHAVANEATGETVGESSHFSVEAPELVNEDTFDVSFSRLELLGQVFDDVTIPYPEGSH